MSLAEHWDGGYLGAGWHHVKVSEYKCFKYNTGNPGVEVHFLSVSTGSKAKDSFSLLPQSLWRLANLAKACGMSREEAATYNPDNPNDHRKLVGLECFVELVKKGDYHEVAGWRSLAEGEPPPPKIDRSGEMPTAQESNRASDIPF